MTVGLWTNGVEIAKWNAALAKLPGSTRHRFRRDLVAFVQTGGLGGVEAPEYCAAINTLRRLGVKAWPGVSFLRDYDGATAASWYDRANWERMAGNVDRLLASDPTGHLVIDLEPYIDEQSGRWPEPGRVGGEPNTSEYLLATAMAPLFDVLRRRRTKLLVAPGGNEYVPVRHLVMACRDQVVALLNEMSYPALIDRRFWVHQTTRGPAYSAFGLSLWPGLSDGLRDGPTAHAALRELGVTNWWGWLDGGFGVEFWTDPGWAWLRDRA